MVLRMSRPWQHPDSGIYYFRQRVPQRLRQLLGREMEKISLRTRDPEEARLEFARVSLEVQQRWRELTAGPRSLSEKQAAGIAGEIYRAMVGEHEHNPSHLSWDGRFAWMIDTPGDDHPEQVLNLDSGVAADLNGAKRAVAGAMSRLGASRRGSWHVRKEAAVIAMFPARPPEHRQEQ